MAESGGRDPTQFTLRELAQAPAAAARTLVTHPYLAVRGLARSALPSHWDLAAFVLLFGTFTLIALAFGQFNAPLATVEQAGIDLHPSSLPWYALRTTLRMLAAMGASLIFSLGYAYLCAYSRRAERVLIPVLDVLQSVPILGFLSFTVTFFLGLFPGKVLGAELASIFAIFTSQAWNMTFSVYQSLRTVPADLAEVTRSLRFTAWQRFRMLELPYAMPGLIWNMMMSMSGGWFFVVASEAITVGNQTITLPGVGSYVAAAIAQRDLGAIGWAIVAMLVVIVLYDQLLFRPLIAYGERFRIDELPPAVEPESWVLRVIERSRLIHWLQELWIGGFSRMRHAAAPARPDKPRRQWPAWTASALDLAWYSAVIGCATYGGWLTVHYLSRTLGLSDVAEAVELASLTMLRVVVLVALASVIWVPVGVTIGLRPRLAAVAQPLAQFLAAFPANLLFPVAVFVIVRLHLNEDVFLSPLMILGTQWYILFNVIAGASVYPRDLLDAAKNLRLRGALWWKRVLLPGILPYYVTGAMTAAGGSWNASIVAEYVDWGHTHLQAHGLGSYIAQATAQGDYPRIVLGVAVMSLFVVAFNRLLWRPLYQRAERLVGLED
jgi:NitT/TauT family transport system permease protein